MSSDVIRTMSAGTVSASCAVLTFGSRSTPIGSPPSATLIIWSFHTLRLRMKPSSEVPRWNLSKSGKLSFRCGESQTWHLLWVCWATSSSQMLP